MKRLGIKYESDLDNLSRLVDWLKILGVFTPEFVAEVHAARKRKERKS